jgi:hypothetical protein
MLNTTDLLNLPPYKIGEELAKLGAFELAELERDTKDHPQWQELRMRYCCIAHPGRDHWPAPSPDEILDTIELKTGPVDSIVCTIDGHRFLVMEGKLMTPEEVSFYYGKPPDEIITGATRDLAQNVRRAAAVLNSKAIQYSVTMGSSDFKIINRLIRAYTRDQLDRYAKRNGMTVLEAK